MKIRGNTVGTPIKPEKVLVKSENLTEEEKAQARANIGAAEQTYFGIVIKSENAQGVYADAFDLDDGQGGTQAAVRFCGCQDDSFVRLMGLADGEEDTDAATVGQVKAMVGENNPVHYIQSTIDNPVSIRTLASGTYLLQGVFAYYEGGQTVNFSTERHILIDRYDDRSELQCFIPNGNRVNHVVVTDTGHEFKTISLSNSENTANRVTTIDSTADDEHYPTAKAVYDALGSGSGTGVSVVQAIGSSNTAVMSQNATTVELRKRLSQIKNNSFTSGSKFADCKEIGYYSFTGVQAREYITDKPADLATAGNLFVFPNSGGYNLYQYITDLNGNAWFRYSASQPWIKMTNKPASPTKWVALGDSITQGWYGYTDDSGNGQNALLTDINARWVSLVAGMNGYTLTNKGVGGTGYVTNGGHSDRKIARQVADEIDFSAYDLVTLAYGVNDWKYDAVRGTMDDDISAGGTFYSNMRYVIEKILTDNPLCKIVVITPLNYANVGEEATNYGLGYSYPNSGTLEDIFEAEKEICEYYGIEYIDMTHSSVVNRKNIKDVLPDGCHPSIDCHKVIAKELSKKINFA